MTKPFSAPDGLPAKSEPEDLSSSAGLLVSILVRYPEVASVKLAPRDGLIRLTFMLHRETDKAEADAFAESLGANLEAFHTLLGQHDLYLGVESAKHGDYTALDVYRDVGSLSREEISLISQLVVRSFDGELIEEAGEPIAKEDQEFQEDMIDALLDDLRVGSGERDLIGYREEGRVFVFNKGDGAARQRA